jgi:hypothetical protein
MTDFDLAAFVVVASVLLFTALAVVGSICSKKRAKRDCTLP